MVSNSVLSSHAVPLTLLGLLAVTPAAARTWVISVSGTGDAATIQAGVDSATAGDTVLVQAGRFTENIDFQGKAIVVTGSDRENSIVDGSSHPESCVRFRSGEGRSSVLQNLTLTGGTGSGLISEDCSFGGGVYIYNSEPTIRMNIIQSNMVNDSGGGIFCSSPNFVVKSPLIDGNIIINNNASVNGGGIGSEGGSSPVITHNLIQNNRTILGDGGGIWIWVNTGGTNILGNKILNNSAMDHGGGMLVVSSSSSPVAADIGSNLVANNNANGSARVFSSGGGMWIARLNASVHNNTLARNSGQGPDSSWGGGNIAAHECSGCIIEENVIAFSLIGGGIRCTGSGPPSIRNNLAWDNLGGDGGGDCMFWWQGGGNIIDNPYFCDITAGDFTVASNSGVMTHPAGPLGAFPVPGCGPVAAQHSTWGALKARYKSPK